jgi:hypothetical protein
MRARRIVWISLAVIPLAALIRMWLVTEGIPYNTDSNESFSAYVQGQSLLHFDPWTNSFLPDDATGYHRGAHPFTYTHGPNLPRYFSALMYLLGIHSLEWQILVSGIVSTLLSLWFIARSFPEPLDQHSKSGLTFGIVVGALFATDFLGVLQFLGNLWRTWHFPLFWGCIWAVRTKPRWSVGFVLFFLAFQLEFLFAIFTATTSLLYLLWTHRGAWKQSLKPRYFAIAAGSIASVALFLGQLVTFYGWRGLLFDLRTTYVARNTNEVEWESIRDFYEKHAVTMWPSSPNWDFRFANYLMVTWENMCLRLSTGVAAAVLASGLISIGLAVLAARARSAGDGDRFASPVNGSVGPLLWAMLAAYLLLGLIIPGYTLNGYTYRWAPLLVFPVVVALSLLVANMAAVARAFRVSPVPPHRGSMIMLAAILGLWIGNSLHQYSTHPDFVHSAARTLASTYNGRSFVSATTFPHMIAHYTRRWAYYSKPVFAGTERLDQSHNWNADRNKNWEYETPEYYLCETMPYSRHLNCEEIAQQMLNMGHELAEHDSGYVIIKLNWRLVSHNNLRTD